jgi:hypothetical protein
MTVSRRLLNPGLRAAVASLALLALIGGYATTTRAATSQVTATRRATAPSGEFGQWTFMIAHTGAFTFTIDVQPLGDAVVFSEVKYIGVDGRETIRMFSGQTTIQLGDFPGLLEVRCKSLSVECDVLISASR